jgi:hypothetical protein
MPKLQDQERAAEIVRLVDEAGFYLADAAEVYGITRERARQIYKAVTGHSPNDTRKKCLTSTCKTRPRYGDRCGRCRERFVETGSYEKTFRPRISGAPCSECQDRPARLNGRCKRCWDRYRYNNDPVRWQAMRDANDKWKQKLVVKKPRNPERLRRIKALVRKGLNTRQIAEKEGIAWQVADYYIKFHGLREANL